MQGWEVPTGNIPTRRESHKAAAETPVVEAGNAPSLSWFHFTLDSPLLLSPFLRPFLPPLPPLTLPVSPSLPHPSPVATLFFCPPEMPRSISLPTTVSAHTSRPRICTVAMEGVCKICQVGGMAERDSQNDPESRRSEQTGEWGQEWIIKPRHTITGRTARKEMPSMSNGVVTRQPQKPPLLATCCLRGGHSQ